MRACFTAFLIVVASFSGVRSQNRQFVDSMLLELNRANDTTRIHILHYLLNEYLQNDLNKAGEYGEQALTEAREAKHEFLTGRSLNLAGLVYEYKGEYEKALNYYLQSLRISEKLGHRESIADNYNNIGVVYYYQGKLEKTEEYWVKALEIRTELKLSSQIAQSQHNLATIYSARNKLPEAEEFFSKALLTFRSLNDRVGEVSCLNNLAGIVKSRGQLAEAEKYYLNALSVCDSANLLHLKANLLNNLGVLYKEQRQTDKALDFFLRGLEVARTLGNRNDIKVHYENLSETYADRGDYKTAYQYKLLYEGLKDSLFSEESDRALAEMETRYETEKKQRQIDTQALEIEKGKNRIFAITGGAIFLLLIAAVLSFYFWQKKRSKEELEQAKSRFFGNIVHEFRTPIGLITGPIEQLISGARDPEQLRNLQLAHRNSKQLLRLINQLMDIAKLESGKLKLNKGLAELIVFLQEILANYQEPAAEKQIALHFHSDRTTLFWYFDADAMEKILANLLSNALKHTPNGGSITLSVHAGEDGLVLQVSDTGSGIPEGEINTIFERYYQATNAHTGTGIGLALVRELTLLHGGEIRASNNEEGGACFTLKFPMEAVERESIPLAPSETPEAFPAEEDPVAGKKLILLVEDHAEMREHILSILRPDYEVMEAVNGIDGLALAGTHIPDLILSDVMMPGMDGFALCEQLKSNPATDHIPLILLTAKAGEHNRISGLEKGADAYLAKPFSARELLLTLRNLFAMREKIQRANRGEEDNGSGQRSTILQTRDPFIRKIIALVEENCGNEDFSIEDLSSALALSRTQVHRKVKALCNWSASQLVRNIRLEMALQLLENHAGNITEIAFRVGFNSQPYFSKCFADYFGYPPTRVKGGKVT